MIISASRRTDIPALYSKWLMNRLRAGWCLVPNPMNTKQVARVSLEPNDVDAMVFWSKNPALMLPRIGELETMGHRFYFQFTLNDYPHELEPRLPSLRARIRTFLELSDRLGPLRVVWRYDPIIISNRTPMDYHRERFRLIADELGSSTQHVVVSILDCYRRTDLRLSRLEQEGYVFEREAAFSSGLWGLLRDLASIAADHRMEMFTCAEEDRFREAGIAPGKCIDEALIDRIWGLSLRYRKDSSQRDACLCTVAKDIGVNDTCVHGCPYCYATRSHALATTRYNAHNPDSPWLWQPPDAKDRSIPENTQSRLF